MMASECVASAAAPGTPAWAALSSAVVRRLPLARYRAMNWLCRRSSARFVADMPGTDRGLRFECDLRNGLSREVFFTGCYEPQETMIIRRLVAPGGTFVDVGAHWGYFSLIVADHVGRGGRVVSIEADPRVYGMLERSLALNDLPQVRPVHAAAAAGTGHVTLIGFDETSDNWGTSRIDGGAAGPGGSYEVPARSVDEILDDLGVDVVDLIKMDIEGAEALALTGMAAGLRRGRYRRLLIELHPARIVEHGTDADALIENLLGHGYRGWVIDHAPGEVRRAAYSPGGRADSFVRPLRRHEPLDDWPHLIFVLDGHPLLVDAPDRRAGVGRTPG
ncbi:FkbM family methyltransferase (plasmid) [Tundrisphaera sp. TA3]|uniref:FkbM family methyltransferase n=1 Tax=Tundrisphaera sp. TA3 TaxID=3435775 RepID=UPI003EB7EBDA